MAEEYKTIEERLFVDTGIKDCAIGVGKGFYGSVATIFRAPTTLRKCINKQTYIDRKKLDSGAEFNGSVVGTVGGIIADIYLVVGTISQTINEQNYIPLAIIGATTLASGVFEWGRFKTSKQERLELKAIEK